MNKKPEITSVCCTLYIFNKVSIILKAYISHICLFWFPFNLSCKQNINLTEVFHVSPRLAFSFLPPVSLEIFIADFSSHIFIFSPIHWPTKSDYSSLFLSCTIRVHIPIETPVQDARISSWRNSHILSKSYLRSLISKTKITCIPVFCLIFSLFLVNPFHVSN